MEKQKRNCPSCGKAFKNLELHITHKHTEVQIDIRDDGTDNPTCLVAEYRNIGTPHERRIVHHEGTCSSSGSRGDDDFYEFGFDKEYKAVVYYPATNKIEYEAINGDHSIKTKIPNWTAEIHKPKSEPIVVKP